MKTTINLSAQPDRDHLRRLLSTRNQYPDQSEAIDAEIRATFERRVAILALDMCGFSRLTLEHGIIHYLAMIEQMESVSRPAVAGNGGITIKTEADNLWAIFDTPERALEAALDVFRAFRAINTVLPVSRDVFGSIGIGYGDTLIIGHDDLFGSEMNLASKLGEDLAGPQEILLTESAYEAVSHDVYQCLPSRTTVSGLSFAFYSFKEKRHRRRP